MELAMGLSGYWMVHLLHKKGSQIQRTKIKENAIPHEKRLRIHYSLLIRFVVHFVSDLYCLQYNEYTSPFNRSV